MIGMNCYCDGLDSGCATCHPRMTDEERARARREDVVVREASRAALRLLREQLDRPLPLNACEVCGAPPTHALYEISLLDVIQGKDWLSQYKLVCEAHR